MDFCSLLSILRLEIMSCCGEGRDVGGRGCLGNRSPCIAWCEGHTSSSMVTAELHCCAVLPARLPVGPVGGGQCLALVLPTGRCPASALGFSFCWCWCFCLSFRSVSDLNRLCSAGEYGCRRTPSIPRRAPHGRPSTTAHSLWTTSSALQAFRASAISSNIWYDDGLANHPSVCSLLRF